MGKRRKDKPEPASVLAHLELQLTMMQHTTALKSIIGLLEAGNIQGAIAKLDGAVSVLHAAVRSQAIGKTYKCLQCDHEQDVIQWIDEKKCELCGEEIDPMEKYT